MEIFATYTGADFLAFYAVMLVTAIFLGLWIPANLRPEGESGAVQDLEEVAVLAGGITRHAMAVSSDLMARGGLAAASANKLRINQIEMESGAGGQAVLEKAGEFDLPELKLATSSEARRVEQRLITRGLMMEQGDRLKLRLLSILPYAALFAIGLYRQQAGAAIGEPTGFLALMMFVTLGIAAIRFFRVNPRTMAGNEALRELEIQSSRLRRAPEAREAGFAVALFGTGVLVGTPWEQVHAMRNSAAGGDAGAGAGGDDGGGSGCGGGCGGCGG